MGTREDEYDYLFKGNYYMIFLILFKLYLKFKLWFINE